MPPNMFSGGYDTMWLWSKYNIECKIEELAKHETKVTINVRYQGWNAAANRYVRIISNGKREKDILDQL